jgi:hypothetical protein
MPQADFDLRTLHSLAKARLPAYARPLFVRICAQIDMTETFQTPKAGSGERRLRSARDVRSHLCGR